MRERSRTKHPSDGPEKRGEYWRKYISVPNNMFKIHARMRLQIEVRAGRIIRQPCEKCGAEKTQAHHEDYSKPLDVRWLCTPCHAAEHTRAVCIRGHVRTPNNIGTNGDCRECHRLRSRLAWQRRKQGRDNQGFTA